MLLAIGAHAVGMSTVHEAMAASCMGVEVAGVSLISNLAAGIAPHRLSHDEVVAEGQRAGARLCALVEGLCARLGRG
jgi:purine-nucleoside phosphorylase